LAQETAFKRKLAQGILAAKAEALELNQIANLALNAVRPSLARQRNRFREAVLIGMPSRANFRRADLDENQQGASMLRLKLLRGAWVFVGDGQKALFLINEGDEKFPNLRRMAVWENPDPPSREHGTDAPGRTHSSIAGIRSAVEETDWHELEKERFAKSVAEQINKAALSNSFEQICIVAPPKILGDLRREFAKETETKIIAQVPKELTNHTIAEIERLLTAE
jgi:protein required for attachment to host cells